MEQSPQLFQQQETRKHLSPAGDKRSAEAKGSEALRRCASVSFCTGTRSSADQAAHPQSRLVASPIPTLPFPPAPSLSACAHAVPLTGPPPAPVISRWHTLQGRFSALWTGVALCPGLPLLLPPCGLKTRLWIWLSQGQGLAGRGTILTHPRRLLNVCGMNRWTNERGRSTGNNKPQYLPMVACQAPWAGMRRGSGQRRHTVITLELLACSALYSLACWSRYLYRKSPRDLHPTQLQ